MASSAPEGPIDATRYARAKLLFEQALPLAAEERGRFLEQSCAGDTGLVREVSELLRHHAAAAGFLTGRAGHGDEQSPRPLPVPKVPGFRIERELGRGGMGVVYLAEQERPRRQVALKFLRLDSFAAGDAARFRREAEILGRLKHPGIAHVYTVGLAESEQGTLPWIAMEYVRGETLREYAAGRALSLRDLVELFVELCDAIQHAHEQGIVHRDLKPTNVLVDERGHVRVLDFGVARLLGASDESGLHTRTGQMIGTLAYASPEQATGKNAEVDTRSDVYALGVMLHELLTGRMPYTIDESKIVETIQAICDEEPERLRKLRRDAPQDLETILLKALDKAAARRYANAGALGDDLRRFQGQLPVQARAPSRIYQARKFVRRNRAFTLSAAAVIAALAVTVGVLLVSRRREQEQSRGMRAMLELFADQVFEMAPALGFGREGRGTLQRLDAQLAAPLALAPRDRVLRGYRARTQYELGTLEQIAGDLAAARAHFEFARATCAALAAEDPTDIAARTQLSMVYARLGELANAERDFAGERAWFQKALELDQALVAEHPHDGELVEDLGWSLERMTDLAMRAGDWAEAERWSEQRLADAERLLTTQPEHWKFLYNAAQAHVLAARIAQERAPAAVEPHRVEALRLARCLKELQPDRGDFQALWAEANHNAAKRASDAGSMQAALPHAEVAFAQALQLLANDPGRYRHADFLRWSFQTLFGLQLALGRTARAAETLVSLRAGAAIAGEGSPNALLLLATADLSESELPSEPEAKRACLQRAIEHYSELLQHPEASSAVREFVAALFNQGLAAYRPELLRHLLAADTTAAQRFLDVLGPEPALVEPTSGVVAAPPPR